MHDKVTTHGNLKKPYSLHVSILNSEKKEKTGRKKNRVKGGSGWQTLVLASSRVDISLAQNLASGLQPRRYDVLIEGPLVNNLMVKARCSGPDWGMATPPW